MITIWSKFIPRRLLYAVLFSCLIVMSGPGHAQAQFTRFENYADEQGLGNASVSALAQDADGYILLGTEAGLYRYDGSTISPYGATAGLSPAAWIRKLFVDDRGRVWAVTTDGIYLRDGSSFTRIEVGQPLHLVSPHVVAVSKNDVIIDNDGTLLRAALSSHATGPFAPLLTPMMAAANPELKQARFVVSDTDGALRLACRCLAGGAPDARRYAVGAES